MADPDGFWTLKLLGSPIRMNALLLQKGAIAGFDNTLTGMMIWDNVTGKFHRITGAGNDVVIDVDAAAATASLRTLGGGANQASPGPHAHTLATGAENTNAPNSNVASAINWDVHLTTVTRNTEVSLITEAVAAPTGNAGARRHVVVGYVSVSDKSSPATTAGDLMIYVGGNLKATTNFVTPANLEDHNAVVVDYEAELDNADSVELRISETDNAFDLTVVVAMLKIVEVYFS